MWCKILRIVFSANVEQSLKGICIEVSKWFDIAFIETGRDQDHVLIERIPMESETKISRAAESITKK
jgi:hypothetical protein